jgi:hypothetical protein
VLTGRAAVVVEEPPDEHPVARRVKMAMVAIATMAIKGGGLV